MLRPALHTSFAVHAARRPRQLSHVYRYSLILRSLSSEAPTSTHHKDAQRAPVPPGSSSPTASTQRKPKYELGPGPIKPKKPIVQQQSTTVSFQANSTPRSTKTSGSQNANASVAETTRKDLEDAEKHGIMKPPPPGAGWFRQLAHKAIELFKFYFRGVKMIFTHRKQVADIKRRIRSGGAPLTRAEFRFIHTYKDDVKKLIPFIIIVLVLEEIIPLIAIYAPFMLPSTCILPSQRARIENAKTTKAIALAAEYRDTLNQLVSRARDKATSQHPLASLDVGNGPMLLCGLMRLSTIGPDVLRRHRIKRHLQFISEDDKLLSSEAMGKHLSPGELYAALEERGIILSQTNVNEQRQLLSKWLERVSQQTDSDEISIRLASLPQTLARS
ncbi:hypothetical protein HGRIS_002249 [Hohenbuehelia grisea]|uniref:Letm1 RBD domain-containing protein n=1 Tax=Hohenbuehelia grisea TaxID=104357 RepID=A0ABR3JLT9_9AGAR